MVDAVIYMTVTLRSAVGPAGGKSAVGKSSSIPHKNPLTVVLAAPQGVTLSSNVAMVMALSHCALRIIFTKTTPVNYTDQTISVPG